MKQEVNVLSTEKGKFVAGCSKSACEGCKSSLFCSSKGNVFEVLNPQNIPLKKGEKVEIELEGKKTVFSVFMSLGFPMLMFLPGYYAAKCFSSSEAILFLGGIAGIVLGFGLAALYFHFTRKKFVPTLSEK